MNDTLTKERQQELFEEFSPSSPKRVERIPVLAKSHKPILITTTTEQILLVSIVSILFFCSLFFLGVLRGKSLQNSIMQEPVRSQAAVAAVPVMRPTARPAAVYVPQRQQAASAATGALPAPSMEAPASSKPYTIQLVTHRGKNMAEAEVLGLRKMGHVSFIIPSGEYYQVCVGQFFSKEEAKKQLRVFSGRFKDSFVRRR